MKVFSPYWEQGFNPHFPNGCSKGISKQIIAQENPLVPEKPKVIRLKREKVELKEAKKDCINPSKLSTVFSNKLN